MSGKRPTDPDPPLSVGNDASDAPRQSVEGTLAGDLD